MISSPRLSLVSRLPLVSRLASGLPAALAALLVGCSLDQATAVDSTQPGGAAGAAGGAGEAGGAGTGGGQAGTGQAGAGAGGEAGLSGGSGQGGGSSGGGGQAGGPPAYGPGCFDGDKGEGETDVDCGGGCPRCHQGQACEQASDCWNGDCAADGRCTAACPAGMAAYAPAPPARPFCLDLTEVTQAAYAAFAATASIERQRPECRLYNPTFAPHTSSPPDTVECTPSAFRPDETPDRPAVCVDWCDADSYCRERGLHLCGRIDAPGTGLEFGKDQSLETDQWYFACAEGDDDHTYVYGPSYEETRCNGRDAFPAAPHLADAGEFADCRSGPGRPVDLSGNAAEFINEWVTDSTLNSPPYVKINGGFFSSSEKELGCKSLRGVPIQEGFANVGFRCCGG